MKKIRLDLDRLQVESFATTAPGEARGTVAGHASFQLSCLETCGDTCDGSCWDTCLVKCPDGGTEGGGGPSGVPSCNCPTQEGCVYPSTSCPATRTYGDATCYCVYPNTDVRVCCSDDAVCTGGGGGMC